MVLTLPLNHFRCSRLYFSRSGARIWSPRPVRRRKCGRYGCSSVDQPKYGAPHGIAIRARAALGLKHLRHPLVRDFGDHKS